MTRKVTPMLPLSRNAEVLMMRDDFAARLLLPATSERG